MTPAWRVLAALVCASASASCTAARWAPPVGTRTPAPGAAASWAEATAGCRAVDTWSATLRVAGRADTERIPTGLSVGIGLTATGRLRLEGRVLGRPAFTLSGTSDRALLRLEREREYVVDRAGAILDVLLGTDLGAERLLALVTGCGTPDATVVEAARVGSFIEIATPQGQVYLERAGAAWRTTAAVTAGFQVDYRAFAGPWPSDLRLRSDPAAAAQVELRVAIEQVLVNAPLNEAAFDATPPAGWQAVELVNVRRGIRAGGV